MNPQFLVNDTVQPGKSLTFPGTWDGTVASDSTATMLTGSFVVTNQLDPSVSAGFQIGAPLSESLNVSQLVNGSASPPLNFVYTITNNSDAAIQFNLAPIDFVVTAPLGTTAGSTVWESNPNASSQPSTPETLQAGQSMTETSSWNGVANEGTLAGANVWGSFNVAASGADDSDFAGIPDRESADRIRNDKSVYLSARPIRPNHRDGNQLKQSSNYNTEYPECVHRGERFKRSFPVTDVSSSAPTVTLQPGQSETFDGDLGPERSSRRTGTQRGRTPASRTTSTLRTIWESRRRPRL